jgi:hypothetical protein
MDESYEDDDLELDDDDDDPRYKEFQVRRLKVLDLIILPVCFLQLVADAAAMTLERLVVILAGHANWKVDQQEFADAIRHDLESIETTEE